MNDLIEQADTKIEDMIYEIRGKQVMLDSDLAKLYQCANGTKSINLAVKRHIRRFPERFVFQLTKDETLKLYSRFQSETLNKSTDHRGYNIKYLPYAFTEQGVAMLATVLKTQVAEEVSIAIMDAFVMMKRYIASNNYDKRIGNLETKTLEHEQKINEIFDRFDKPVNNHIFFKGEIYDAYSLLIDILDESSEEIIIIDNYVDKKLLDILSKTNKKILIITTKINDIDLEKYREQYNNVEIIINNCFHDRFIILDKRILYHCGASFKDLGKKCFSINKIEHKNSLSNLLYEISKL